VQCSILACADVSEEAEALLKEIQVLQETQNSERNTSPFCCHVNVATMR
jgi:hypothetical protein